VAATKLADGAARAPAVGGHQFVLAGYFVQFDRWIEVASVSDGKIIERIDRKAFRKTLADRRDRIPVLVEHGRSPLGETPLGSVSDLRQDHTGVWVEIVVADELVPQLLPRLQHGLYGASVRFEVLRDHVDGWRRTILEARLLDFSLIALEAAMPGGGGRFELAPCGVEEVQRAELLRAVSENRATALRWPSL
jgi:HK97 family phage prohead protease